MTCFHLTHFYGQEKFSWLPSKNKVTDEKTEHCNLARKLVCLQKCQFSPVILFLKGCQKMCNIKSIQMTLKKMSKDSRLSQSIRCYKRLKICAGLLLLREDIAYGMFLFPVKKVTQE